MRKRPFAGLFFFLFCLTFSAMAADHIVYESGNRRDPFIPLVGPNGIAAQKIAQTNLHIEGIVIDPEGGSLALIDGEFYKQGDSIGKATIISIFPDRVILEQDDEEKTLWIREEIAPGGEKNHDATPASPKK